MFSFPHSSILKAFLRRPLRLLLCNLWDLDKYYDSNGRLLTNGVFGNRFHFFGINGDVSALNGGY